MALSRSLRPLERMQLPCAAHVALSLRSGVHSTTLSGNGCYAVDGLGRRCLRQESFFATLERELLNRCRFKTQTEARLAVLEWFEGWYNPHRRHSSLGYLSPVNYERRLMTRETETI